MSLWHPFSVFGVETWFSPCTSMVDISGTLLLMPFQMSVLDLASPAASATNLVFNLLAIPGGMHRYERKNWLFWPLALVITAGGAPGTSAGIWLRTHWLGEEAAFKPFAAVILAHLAWRMLVDVRRGQATVTTTG